MQYTKQSKREQRRNQQYISIMSLIVQDECLRGLHVTFKPHDNTCTKVHHAIYWAVKKTKFETSLPHYKVMKYPWHFTWRTEVSWHRIWGNECSMMPYPVNQSPDAVSDGWWRVKRLMVEKRGLLMPSIRKNVPWHLTGSLSPDTIYKTNVDDDLREERVAWRRKFEVTRWILTPYVRSCDVLTP